MKRGMLLGLTAGSVLFFSGEAAACPACTGREGGGKTRTWLVAGMVSLPFLIAGGALLGLRSVSRREADAEDSGGRG